MCAVGGNGTDIGTAKKETKRAGNQQSSRGPQDYPAALCLLYLTDIVVDQLSRLFRPDGAIHTQFILVGVAPLMAGDALIIRASGGVRPGNAFSALGL